MQNQAWNPGGTAPRPQPLMATLHCVISTSLHCRLSSERETDPCTQDSGMGNTALYEQGLERAETRVRPPWLFSLGLHTCCWEAVGLLAGGQPPSTSPPPLLSMSTESCAKPL